MPRPNVREQLLEAGLETLHRHGFNSVAVQDITQAAGVPKGSFYNHFPSKEALGAEVVRRYVEQRRGYRAVLSDPAREPLERVHLYFAALVRRALEMGSERGCLIGNFSTELSGQSPLIREELQQSFQEWSGTLAAALDEAQRAGQLSPGLPASELADLLINSWEGAVLRGKVEQSAQPIQTFLNVTLGRLLV